jgi:hypothetical protein
VPGPCCRQEGGPTGWCAVTWPWTCGARETHVGFCLPTLEPRSSQGHNTVRWSSALPAARRTFEIELELRLWMHFALRPRQIGAHGWVQGGDAGARDRFGMHTVRGMPIAASIQVYVGQFHIYVCGLHLVIFYKAPMNSFCVNH